jgi:hypothetical protein
LALFSLHLVLSFDALEQSSNEYLSKCAVENPYIECAFEMNSENIIPFFLGHYCMSEVPQEMPDSPPTMKQ